MYLMSCQVFTEEMRIFSLDSNTSYSLWRRWHQVVANIITVKFLPLQYISILTQRTTHTASSRNGYGCRKFIYYEKKINRYFYDLFKPNIFGR